MNPFKMVFFTDLNFSEQNRYLPSLNRLMEINQDQSLLTPILYTYQRNFHQLLILHYLALLL